eukprot:scaffold4336_cov376-Prasinococcus_capsulatus_cf.AAC.1
MQQRTSRMMPALTRRVSVRRSRCRPHPAKAVEKRSPRLFAYLEANRHSSCPLKTGAPCACCDFLGGAAAL